MAIFAMFFGLSATSSAEMITDLEPRGAVPTKPVGAAFDGAIDLLVKEHSDIVVKAFADVCTDANLSTDITTDIRVQIRYEGCYFMCGEGVGGGRGKLSTGNTLGWIFIFDAPCSLPCRLT